MHPRQVNLRLLRAKDELNYELHTIDNAEKPPESISGQLKIPRECKVNKNFWIVGNHSVLWRLRCGRRYPYCGGPFFHSALQHRLVGYSGGESFIVTLYRHFRHSFTQLVDEWLDISCAFRGGTVELGGEAYDDFLHLFAGAVVGEPLQQVACAHCCQGVGADLKGSVTAMPQRLRP